MALLAKLLFLVIGAYMLFGSILSWDSLLNGRREKRLAELIGKTGVRFFYGFMGMLLITISVMMFFNNFDFLFQ